MFDRIQWPVFFAKLAQENRAIDTAFVSGKLRQKIGEMKRDAKRQLENEDEESAGGETGDKEQGGKEES